MVAAKVYAHAHHWYTHYDTNGKRIDYVFPAGECREVPDDVARVVVEGAPQKLVILTGGQERPEDVAQPTAPEPYETREVEEPPTDRMATPRRARRRRA